ncbi:Histone-lysine N-methyltransferase ash1 [Madurella mycetomatis]|uniref:Histone-lysine N-methyltransferase ash1 n=1 Tax=Madurella mycetomatis TaxID=100816 RepID=A0A175WGU1_9PEZI|nr:Histone-lysine N-methyltransferase ash1 [Madurella mycetomatis]
MAPIKPHWVRPSHPEIQEVLINEAEFTTRSISKIALPPFGLFAKLDFPPCTVAAEPTYATVQMGRDKHLDLNSDLLYINHSCEPSLIFDTANMNVIAGPQGLQPGEELTFFYPSTEWHMAQPFDCLCGKPTCRGRISGAEDMNPEQLDGLWLNGHIRELLEAKKHKQKQNGAVAVAANGNVTAQAPAPENGAAVSNAQTGRNGNHHTAAGETVDQTAQALRDALAHAEKVVEAARLALISYVAAVQGDGFGKAGGSGNGHFDAAAAAAVEASMGLQRRGPTSRELSGEMGGDTSVSV